VAEGKLVPDTYLKIVQPTDAGVVKEILVSENQSVKVGQVLIRMDTALSASDLKALTADYHSKRIAPRRIDAQLAGTRSLRAPMSRLRCSHKSMRNTWPIANPAKARWRKKPPCWKRPDTI
jgi:multidrug efflux pump subunit AcrA (membrane-fusion protein)